MRTLAWLLLPLIVFGVFWYRRMGDLEQARDAARRLCREAGVQFLDDSVVRERWWIARDSRRRLRLWSRYRFEFSTRGDRRYRGSVDVVAGRAGRPELEPWVVDEPPDQGRL